MSDSFDPFAYARQDDGVLPPDEQELLQAFRALPLEKRDAIFTIVTWAVRRDRGEDQPDLDRQLTEETARRKLIPADRDRLRAVCEELAAEYRAPLPEGDAGLAEAVDRYIALHPRHDDLLTFDYGPEEEKEIVGPTLDAAQTCLENRIEAWRAEGLRGVAAKLRFMLVMERAGWQVDLEDGQGEQLIEVIEREIARAGR
jgi:hypothetical protein